jgi:hypothetical protein
MEELSAEAMRCLQIDDLHTTCIRSAERTQYRRASTYDDATEGTGDCMEPLVLVLEEKKQIWFLQRYRQPDFS